VYITAINGINTGNQNKKLHDRQKKISHTLTMSDEACNIEDPSSPKFSLMLPPGKRQRPASFETGLYNSWR
jgi:hypothetical protein